MAAAPPDAARLAALHAQAFRTPRPWSANEIAALLRETGVFLLEAPEGFLIGRVVTDEAELLTLAVAPVARRRGTGRALTAGFAEAARAGGGVRAFLEVAEDNAGARALYAQAGWREAGRRRGYYATPEGRRIDAVVMTLALTIAP